MKPHAPPAFDLITSVGRAYQTVWNERRYLLRLAAVPFLLKIIFFTLGYVNGGDDNILRLSVILVPAWLAEGWMLSHVVRLVLLGQRWPFRPTGDRAADLPALHARYRGVMGGALAFALTQLVIGGWIAVLIQLVPVRLAEPTAEIAVSAEAAFAACALIGTAIYFFRFIWLYVAAAADVPLRAAADRLSRGMMTSVRLIGVWLLCAVPAMVAIQVAVGLILMLAGPESAGDAVMVLGVVARAALDIIKNLLCAVALAYIFQSLFGKVIRA